MLQSMVSHRVRHNLATEEQQYFLRQSDVTFFACKKPLKMTDIRKIKESSASGVLVILHIYEIYLSVT